jgi:hypothetical protein
MKHIIHSAFYWYDDKAWYINSKVSGIRTDILRAILKQLTIMLNHHRKVFVFRFDLHTPSYTETNEQITSFNRRLFPRIERHYKVNRISFLWVREQEKAKQQHYHYVLILNGSKVRSPYEIQDWIKEIWEFQDGTCQWAGFHNLNRNEEEDIQKASYHLSYLAKPRGKGYRPSQTKDFGSSRIKG